VDEGVELIDPVEVDETVFTSGLENSRYPKGIPIGRVTSVLRSQSDQSQKLEVRLFADLIGLNYVHVLLWQPAA
jgi:cell shape-determining protein MreC